MTVDYWILRTDYSNYAVAYGCTNRASDRTCEHAQAALWSRTPTLEDDYVETAGQMFSSVCLNLTTFIQTTKTDGKYQFCFNSRVG